MKVLDGPARYIPDMSWISTWVALSLDLRESSRVVIEDMAVV